jgi:hypothetical protein
MESLNFVFFHSPILIILYSVALLFLLLDFFAKKIKYIFKIIFALSFISALTLHILNNASYQEILVFAMVFLIFALTTLHLFKKEEKNDI